MALRQGIAQRALCAAVLLVTLSATFLLWRHELAKQSESRQAALDTSLRETSTLLQQRVAGYERTLRGLRGLAESHLVNGSKPTASEIKTYVQILDLASDMSGLRRLGVAWIRPAEQAQGPTLNQAPGLPLGEATAAAFRLDVQLEPASPDGATNLGFEPDNQGALRQAMERARDSGGLTVTGKTAQRHEPDGAWQPGFFMVLPVYRQPPHNTLQSRRSLIAGWVYAPLQMASVLNTLYGMARNATSLKIYDGVDLSPDRLMYDQASDADPPALSAQTAYEYIEIAGHTWTLAMRSVQGHGRRSGDDASKFIALAGCILSLLLTALTWQLSTARARATALAQEMTVELRQLATTDFLTGLANRRAFMAKVGDELARLQRAPDQRAAMLMLDLDHFKHINDQHGHAAGDAVLQHFAQLAAVELRKNDMAGRVGGEEFAILLPGADVVSAQAFAERLRTRLRQNALDWQGRTIAVTVSIGIAALDHNDGSPDAVLVRADQALYRAKAGGRDQVVSA
jgi:diguanylate cyclase (GGDEF)-like protein